MTYWANNFVEAHDVFDSIVDEVEGQKVGRWLIGQSNVCWSRLQMQEASYPRTLFMHIGRPSKPLQYTTFAARRPPHAEKLQGHLFWDSKPSGPLLNERRIVALPRIGRS